MIFFFCFVFLNFPSCQNSCEEKTKITESESDDELMIELDSFESRNVFLSQTNAAKFFFFHPPGPAASFYWPQREDLCIITLEHIIVQLKHCNQVALAECATSKKSVSEKQKSVG